MCGPKRLAAGRPAAPARWHAVWIGWAWPSVAGRGVAWNEF